MINNWIQFINESEDKLDRMVNIPEDININQYLKSNFIKRNNKYYFEDDDNKLTKIDFYFEGDDILVYPDGKYKLLMQEINPGDIYFDIRYPNEINILSNMTSQAIIPFGLQRWNKSENGSKYLDSNDTYILLKKVNDDEV